MTELERVVNVLRHALHEGGLRTDLANGRSDVPEIEVYQGSSFFGDPEVRGPYLATLTVSI